MDNNPSEKEIYKYKETIDKYDLRLLTNYFKCKIELDFLQHIKRKEPLEYTFQIVNEIYKTLGYNIIKKNDKLDWDYMQITKYQRGVFNNLKNVIKNISSVIAEITNLFGFQYNYSVYITLNFYFKRVLEILYTEFSLLPKEDVYIEDEINTDNELIKQRKILSELTDWNNVDRLFNILYNLDGLYNFKELKKLDRCCIALLLIKYCPLFDTKTTKPFCNFRKMICEYYDTSDVTFKENDCKDRIEEVYNEQKGFWRYDTKKNPRQR